jgi:hypothetical protein
MRMERSAEYSRRIRKAIQEGRNDLRKTQNANLSQNKAHCVVALHLHPGAERRSQPVQETAEPLRVPRQRTVWAKTFDLHRDKSPFPQFAIRRIQRCQVHQA